jgi:hypothetical protein
VEDIVNLGMEETIVNAYYEIREAQRKGNNKNNPANREPHRHHWQNCHAVFGPGHFSPRIGVEILQIALRSQKRTE